MQISHVAGFGPVVRDVESALEELAAAGHRVLRGAQMEPWGQTTSRLLSPEGLLVGITFTPWQHEALPPA